MSTCERPQKINNIITELKFHVIIQQPISLSSLAMMIAVSPKEHQAINQTNDDLHLKKHFSTYERKMKM